jgi:hypothetical protein
MSEHARGLTFEEGPHEYRLDGVKVPSVTGILSASGVVDFSQIPMDTRETALLRGTNVHRAIQFWNEHDLDFAQYAEDFPDYAGYVLGWITFCEQRHPEPWACEYRVASRTHRYAGTIDYLGVLDGEAVLLDFATGDPADAAKNLQTAGYLAAALEWRNEDGQEALREFLEAHAYIKRYGVRLTATGGFSLHRYEAPTDFTEFLTLTNARRIVERYKGERAAWPAQ